MKGKKVNPSASALCAFIKEEVQLIQELNSLSVNFKDIVAYRDLNALEENNKLKRAALLKMLPIQKKKDSLISELSLELGLHEDSSIRGILDSGKLDQEAASQITNYYKLLEDELVRLDDINSFISIILLSSFRLLKNSISLFSMKGTTDSLYSRSVSIKNMRKHTVINEKI